MTEKPTPRVGDRVIYRDDVVGTKTGDVLDVFNDEFGRRCRLILHGESGTWTTRVDRVTVVDREPVEWPEGWEVGTGFGVRYASLTVRNHPAELANLFFRREDLERIVADGPEVLANWDELMGDS